MQARDRQGGILPLLGSLVVAAVAVACLVTVVAWKDRLRAGLVIGLMPFSAIFVISYLVGRRRGFRRFAEWTLILFLGLIPIPLAEIAAYPFHSSRYRAAKESATTEGDRLAMDVYRSTKREQRGSVPMLAPTTSPFFNINTDGYRGRDFVPARPESIRIAMTGGSAVFGTGVADDATLPAQLEMRLRRSVPAPVEVINLGQEAITFATELQIVLSLALRLKPRIVIFHHGANDFIINGWAPAVRSRRADLVARDTVANRLVDRIQQSVLLRYLHAAIVPATVLSAQEQTAAIDRAVAQYLESRRQAEAICQSNELICLFFIQPIVTDRRSPAYSEFVEIEGHEQAQPGFGNLYARFVAAVIDRHRTTIDLRDVIADDSRVLFLDWAHLSRIGNGLLADRIAVHVIEALERPSM